jgi:hypothetical protein
MPITRRRLLASSGAGLAGTGAIAALSACGSEEEDPSPERDVELLNAALAAQTTVVSAYEFGGEQSLEPIRVFAEDASNQVQQLTEAIETAGGTPAEPDGNPPEAESAVEAATLALNDAIAAYHAAAGDLSTSELNGMVLEFITADAAQLAALRGELGEEQAPQAFVTGLEEPPLVATEGAA